MPKPLGKKPVLRSGVSYVLERRSPEELCSFPPFQSATRKQKQRFTVGLYRQRGPGGSG